MPKEDLVWKVELTQAGTWKPRLPHGHGATLWGMSCTNGKMWIMGGFIPQRVNDVWSSSDGREWTEATPEAPWAVRNLPNCVVFDDKMWIMAGGSYVDNQDRQRPDRL